MFRRPIMRGLMLTVNNIVANAYVPTAVPVSLRRLDKDVTLPAGEIGTINASHPNFNAYKKELDEVVERRFGVMIASI